MANPNASVRWPAEWEPQAAVWLAWPHNQDTWPGYYEPVPAAMAGFVKQIAETTPVRMLADQQWAPVANKHLAGIKNVELIDIKTNDCWIRDYGPTMTITDQGQLLGVHWHFNAWGGKYSPWDSDSQAAQKILSHLGVACRRSPLHLEGGAIETDGQRRLLLTEDCVLVDSRNPGLTKRQVEHELATVLGVNEFIWLTGGGLIGDDTDGHIDQIARFISTDHIVVAACEPDDPNYAALQENFRQLQSWSKTQRAGVSVHQLPLPAARHIDGQRVPESYCNFLITGPQVIVPQFACPDTDRRAIAILAELMPKHDVVGVPAQDLSWGLGAFHCMSQQQPLVG